VWLKQILAFAGIILDRQTLIQSIETDKERQIETQGEKKARETQKDTERHSEQRARDLVRDVHMLMCRCSKNDSRTCYTNTPTHTHSMYHTNTHVD